MLHLGGEALNGQETHLVVLDTDELNTLLRGKPLHTDNKEIVVCWTPDLQKLRKKIEQSDGTAVAAARLLDQAARGG